MRMSTCTQLDGSGPRTFVQLYSAVAREWRPGGLRIELREFLCGKHCPQRAGFAVLRFADAVETWLAGK